MLASSSHREALLVAGADGLEAIMEAAHPDRQLPEHASDTASMRTESSRTTKVAASTDVDKQTRRERNRYHARVSRERRRNHEKVLQESMESLEKENEEIALANEKLTHMVLGDIPTETQHDINELARQNLALQLMMFRMIGPTLEEQFASSARQAWNGNDAATGSQFNYAGLPGFLGANDNVGQQMPGVWPGGSVGSHTPSPPPNKQGGR